MIVFKYVQTYISYGKDIYISILDYPRVPSMNLRYAIGEKTVPNIEGSLIFCFDSIESILKFEKLFHYSEFTTTAILECDAEIDSSAPTIRCVDPQHSMKFFVNGKEKRAPCAKYFWSMPDEKSIYRLGIAVTGNHQGTVMCKWVTPLSIAGVLRNGIFIKKAK